MLSESRRARIARMDAVLSMRLLNPFQKMNSNPLKTTLKEQETFLRVIRDPDEIRVGFRIRSTRPTTDDGQSTCRGSQALPDGQRAGEETSPLRRGGVYMYARIHHQNLLFLQSQFREASQFYSFIFAEISKNSFSLNTN